MSITITLELRQAAAVRQALFESTKGFTSDPTCVPPRVVDIRKVIEDLDTGITAAIE